MFCRLRDALWISERRQILCVELANQIIPAGNRAIWKETFGCRFSRQLSHRSFLWLLLRGLIDKAAQDLFSLLKGYHRDDARTPGHRSRAGKALLIRHRFPAFGLSPVEWRSSARIVLFLQGPSRIYRPHRHRLSGGYHSVRSTTILRLALFVLEAARAPDSVQLSRVRSWRRVSSNAACNISSGGDLRILKTLQAHSSRIHSW